MRLKGRVREWHDDKGFGFIEPMLPGPSVFLHIKAFTRSGRRPQVGDVLTYELGQDTRGRPRAERVSFSLASTTAAPWRPSASRRAWAIPLGLLTLAAIAVAWVAGAVPAVVPGIYVGMSLFAYALYAWDKVAARGDRWRTSESTLLLAGLLGGWPGALIAQETLRHKTAKASFQSAFWAAVLINVTCLGWVIIGSDAHAAPKAYWVCVDTTGVRKAQDSPCDSGVQTLSSPTAKAALPAPPRAKATLINPPAAIPAGDTGTRTQLESSQSSTRPNPFQPLIDLVWKWAVLIIAIVIFITTIKTLIRNKETKKAHRRNAPTVRTESKVGSTLANTDLDSDLSWVPDRRAAVASPPAKPTEWDMSLLRALEWKRFEELCERFWILKGYPARLTTAGADGGVDVVIPDQRDPSKTFAVAQCKSWASRPVGVEPVRALWGSKDHFKATLAMFYGLSGFTDDAQAFADGKHLKLISGEDLLQQIRSLAASEQTTLLDHVTRGDFTTPTCPACDIKMVRRKGRAGKPDFWGCKRFRTCGARPILSR